MLITTSASVTWCAHPVVHEQVLHDEVGHQGFEWSGKLLRGQLSQVAQRGQRRDELLQIGRVQALVQRLRKHAHTDGGWVTSSSAQAAKTRCFLPRSWTDLKDLSEVRVPVGEHGVDAVDGVLGLSWGPPLGFGLQYRQQDTEGSQRDKDSYKVQQAGRKCCCVNDGSSINAHDWI